MIIDFIDIKDVRPIADNISEEKRLKTYIEEAETLYLIPTIGAEIYHKIETDKDNYKELLNGGMFDNDKQFHPGLKKAMGYLTYSRFILNQSVNITAFGAILKKSEFSEQAPEKTIIRMSNEANKIGMEYLNQCIVYMKYERILSNCSKAKITRNKFRSIGK